MGSKSILLLGIVIVFLINVLAIHDYVNNNYYSTKTKPKLKPIVLKEDKNKKTILPATKDDSKTQTKEEITRYKAIYKSNLNKELESQKNIIVKSVKKENKSKNKKLLHSNTINDKKSENEENENDDLHSLLTIDFNINQKYESNSPVIKKLLSKLDKDKKIVIEIFQYSLKIQDYLKEIKSDLVERGVDIDDISTIYKKDKNKKDKIKLLLVKKD